MRVVVKIQPTGPRRRRFESIRTGSHRWLGPARGSGPARPSIRDAATISVVNIMVTRKVPRRPGRLRLPDPRRRRAPRLSRRFRRVTSESALAARADSETVTPLILSAQHLGPQPGLSGAGGARLPPPRAAGGPQSTILPGMSQLVRGDPRSESRVDSDARRLWRRARPPAGHVRRPVRLRGRGL